MMTPKAMSAASTLGSATDGKARPAIPVSASRRIHR
jgi:hypothetical protein